jgi:hypothetical protein
VALLSRSAITGSSAATINSAADRQLPQPAHAVALAVDAAAGVVLADRAREEQIAVFRGEQEQEAIHQPQQLAVQLGPAQLTTGELAPQLVIRRVLQQAIAQGFEGLLHAMAQLPQNPLARLLGLLLPGVEHAAGRLRMAEAAGVQEEPERGELIEQLALHQQLQIHLQVGRLHQ